MSVRYEKRKPKGDRKSESKPRKRGRLTEKTLELLRFVTDRIDDPEARSRGREVVALWDAEYPQWAYRVGHTQDVA